MAKRARRRNPADLDEDVLKWLLDRTNKGKGIVQIPMVERAFDVLPGWSIKETETYRPLTDGFVIEFLLADWLVEWNGAVSGALSAKNPVKFYVSSRDAIPAFRNEVTVVKKEPTNPKPGSLYATEPVEMAEDEGRPWRGTPVAFEVKHVWLGVPGWVVTAPDGQSVTLPSPISRRGKPLDPNRLEGWPTFWTWTYKHGLVTSAKEALADHADAVKDLLLPAAERKRVQQARTFSPVVIKLLEEIVDNQFNVVRDGIFEEYLNAVARFMKAQDAVRDASPRERREFFRDEFDHSYYNDVLRRTTDTLPLAREWRVLRPNYEDIAFASATFAAKSLRDEFVQKNGSKLSRIVDEKGNLASAMVTKMLSGRDFGGEMLFKFDDGSRFTVRNKAVGKVSQQGKWFYQFPTTFHNVVMPDGSKLSQPSEQRMQDVFAKASGPRRNPSPSRKSRILNPRNY